MKLLQNLQEIHFSNSIFKEPCPNSIIYVLTNIFSNSIKESLEYSFNYKASKYNLPLFNSRNHDIINLFISVRLKSV